MTEGVVLQAWCASLVDSACDACGVAPGVEDDVAGRVATFHLGRCNFGCDGFCFLSLRAGAQAYQRYYDVDVSHNLSFFT